MKYAKFSKVKEGDILITDGAFTCMNPNSAKVVKRKLGLNGGLYIDCREGGHMIDGQLDERGFLIGLRRSLICN